MKKMIALVVASSAFLLSFAPIQSAVQSGSPAAVSQVAVNISPQGPLEPPDWLE